MIGDKVGLGFQNGNLPPMWRIYYPTAVLMLALAVLMGASIAVNLVGYVVNVFFVILIFAFMLFGHNGFFYGIHAADS